MGIYRAFFAFWIAALAALVACSSSSPSAPTCCSVPAMNLCQCPDKDAGYGVSTTNGVCGVTITDAVGEMSTVAGGGHLVASCAADAGL